MTMAVTVTTTESRNDQTKPKLEPRLAEPDEIEDVMAICRALHKENGQFPMDEPSVRERLVKALNQEQYGIVGVIGGHHQIEAIIYMLVSTFWYTKEPHLEEIFSYVLQRHRQSTHARQLIEWAKEQADILGVKLFIGIVSNERTEAKIRLYRRQLGNPVGAYFIYGKGRHAPNIGAEH